MFGVDASEVRRFKKEAFKGRKTPKRKSPNYNFGVSRADVARYRKQARA